MTPDRLSATSWYRGARAPLGRYRLACAPLALVLLTCATTATAAPAKKYLDLRNALMSGKSVVVTTNFNECTAAGGGASGPAVSGGFRIAGFLIPDNQYIAFSDVHQTLNNDNERLTEYIRYRVMPDFTVSIRTTTLASDGKVTRQTEYTCPGDKAVRFYAR